MIEITQEMERDSQAIYATILEERMIVCQRILLDVRERLADGDVSDEIRGGVEMAIATLG